MTDLTRGPQTDPTPIYRPRDGLYASDLLTAALVHLDMFTGLGQAPADLAGVCRRHDIQERPAEVMMTLFRAMGLIRCEDGVFRLTGLAREHLVRSSPWFIGPYYASLKNRPVCLDLLQVLRTGRPANWGRYGDGKDWAQAMADEAFAEPAFTKGSRKKPVLSVPQSVRFLWSTCMSLKGSPLGQRSSHTSSAG